MNAKTKVLLLDTNDAVGGVVRVHTALLRMLDRQRFDLYAAVLGHGMLLPEFRAVPDVTLWTMEAGTKPAGMCTGLRSRLADAFGAFALFGSALHLAARCRRAGIQAIHTSDKKRALLLTLLLHRMTGIPYLYHIHSSYVDYAANRWAPARAAAVIANSGEMRRDFIEWLGPRMERISVVYNGIDTERFRPGLPSGLRTELGLAQDAVLIGIASRLAPDKGQETFVRAAARVVAQEPDARFALIGDDSIYSDNSEYVPMLRRLAKESGLENHLAFLGFRTDMVSIYSGLDVLVNAAWREAFGLVVVEAMACGKIVVGTQAGGIPEIVTHGRDGFLFPVRDERALADILVELVRKPELRRTVGAAARQTVLERFGIRSQVKAIEALYEEIAGVSAAAAFAKPKATI